MVIINNTKDTKFSAKYNETLKNLSLILDEKTTDDTKKESKQLEKLLTENGILVNEKQKLEEEIAEKEQKISNLTNIHKVIAGVDKEIQRITDHTNGNGDNIDNKAANFLNGTTTRWLGDSWTTKVIIITIFPL